MSAIRVRSVSWVVVVLALASATAVVWSSGTWRASASPSSDESTLVPVTPTRILDTRDPIDLGLDGPFVSPVSEDLQVAGEVPSAGGVQTVVPEGATGVVLNVTVVGPTAAGFVSVRPAGTPGPPTTSSLNFEAGVITPNAVSVQLPTSGEHAGRIELTYDAFGVAGPTADMMVDVVAYTSSTGLADLAARVSTLEGQVGSLQSDLSSANAEMGSLRSQLDAKQDACADGSVLAFGFIDLFEFADEWTELEGWSCTGTALEAERTSEGMFRLRLPGRNLNSPDASIQLTGFDMATEPLNASLHWLAPAVQYVRISLRAVTSNMFWDGRAHITVHAAPPV